MTARGSSPLLDLGLLAIPSFRRGVLAGTLFFFTSCSRLRQATNKANRI
jgi:hypothetical protein